MNKLLLIAWALGTSQQILAQDFPQAPICAQTCLANATQVQDECVGLDVKCLCTQMDFLSSLYCCLSKSCSGSDQQKGVDFNIASCGAVNETAPAFVGCAPLTNKTDSKPDKSADSDPASKSSAGLSSGAIAGIVISMIILLGLIGAFIVFFLRRRKAGRLASSAAPERPVSSHFSNGEMAVASPTSNTHELASPRIAPTSPSSPGSAWIGNVSGASPRPYSAKSSTDYQQQQQQPQQSQPQKPQRPIKPARGLTQTQELPGSTFIFEHHPAYSPTTSSRPESDASAANVASGAVRSPTAAAASIQSSPPRTPGIRTPRSPSPPPSVAGRSNVNGSPPTVSPLVGPKKI